MGEAGFRQLRLQTWDEVASAQAAVLPQAAATCSASRPRWPRRDVAR
jgi:hypothetical protein